MNLTLHDLLKQKGVRYGRYNLVPTKVMTDDKAAYIEALSASREEESMLPFQSFMLQEHIKNLKAEIEQYERSMDDDVVINVGKDFKNVGKENCYDTYY